MKRIALVALTLAHASACTVEAWEFPARLAPEGPAGWSERVQRAAGAWNVAVEAACGFAPFTVDERDEGGEGYRVQLRPEADWPLRWKERNYWGMSRGTEIFVLDSITPEAQHWILVHELGHAMGLEHSEDPASALFWAPKASAPTDEDALAAMTSLGCL